MTRSRRNKNSGENSGKNIFHWLKKGFITFLWGKRFYSIFLRPLDRILVPDDEGAVMPPALNAFCRFSDTLDPEWRQSADILGLDLSKERYHRKSWEFAQIIYGLRRLRMLTPRSKVLDIGAGHEELIYFLANRVKMIHAVDLYADQWVGGESEADVLLHPEKYAPFAFDRERLRLARMDALNLDFADETFDVIVSLSALEHFGGRGAALRSLREMHRVLKPGGVIALTTEIRLNRLAGRHDSFFLEPLLQLITAAGLEVTEPLRLMVEREFLKCPVTLPMETLKTPHLILRFLNTMFSSFSLFLRKPAGSGEIRAALGDEEGLPLRPFVYRAAWKIREVPERISAAMPFFIKLELENSGDVTWFRHRNAPVGASPVFSEKRSPGHVVRLGVSLLHENLALAEYALCRFEIPHDVRPGQRIDLDLNFPPIRKTGTFLIRLDLVKELCFWFADKGSPGLDIQVKAE